jgi:hypothetical protein
MKRTYRDEMHRIGRISGITVIAFIFLIPTVVCLYFNIFPPITSLLKGIAMICMIYIPISIAEVLTYAPMLGSSASYLVFVTGNLTNLKIPCAKMAMEQCGVKSSTEEGDVIATISVAASSITTVFIVFIGMLLIKPIEPIITADILQPAFDNILPALFGALGAFFIKKEWRLAMIPLIVIITISLIVDISGILGVFIPVMGAVAVLSSRFMYKKGWLNKVKG